MSSKTAQGSSQLSFPVSMLGTFAVVQGALAVNSACQTCVVALNDACLHVSPPSHLEFLQLAHLPKAAIQTNWCDFA